MAKGYDEALRRIEKAKRKNKSELDLSRLNLKKLPANLMQLTNIKSLNISHNNISEIPAYFIYFKYLTVLNLENNKIVKLPDFLGQLKNIKELNISYLKLYHLPKFISKLHKLTNLNATGIGLSEVPRWINKLKNLESLIMSNNNITFLPDNFFKLYKLKYLYLYNCNISKLSKNITNLTQLKLVFFNGCPLVEPPIEITEQGVEAIFDYFHSMDAGSIKVYEAKLMIIGEPGAGKTTLRRKLINPNALMPEEKDSTHGIDIDKWEYKLDNNQYTINLWDFGGQEILHSTHQFFMCERALYVLLADSRKDNTDYIDWLHKIELFAGNSPKIIVHNEKDDRLRLIDMIQISKRFHSIPEPMRCNLAKIIGTDREIDFVNIVDELKHKIKHLDVIGQEFPKAWIELRKNLGNIYNNDKQNYITSQKYFTLCKELSIEKDTSLTLGRYLHAIGAILYFDNDPVLKHTVILNPEWGTDAVYKVIEDTTVQNNMGKFNDNDLKRIWAESIYEDKQHELLKLMMNFKICYKTPNADCYILPQLLPFQPEDKDYNWDIESNLHFEYRYTDYYLKSIMIRFIVEMNKYIESPKTVWRNGVVLRKDNNRAEIIADEKNRIIHIRVSGTTRRDFLTTIRNKFDNIHGEFNKLKVEQRVPCNCDVCKNSQNPTLFHYSKLIDRLSNNKYTIECEKDPYNEINVQTLINDFPPTEKGEREYDVVNKKIIINNHGEMQFNEECSNFSQDNIDADNSVVGDVTKSKVKIKPRVNTTIKNKPEIKSEKKNWWQKLRLAYKIIVPILVIGSITILVLSTLGVIDISQTAKDVFKLIGRID